MSMNVFELFGSVGLDTAAFEKGLSSIESGASSISGIMGTIINVVKKTDETIVGISDTVATTTAEVIVTASKFAKSLDDDIMGVVDKAQGFFVDAFSKMASAATGFIQDFVSEGMSFDSAMGQVSATLLKTRDDFDSSQVAIDGFSGSLRDLAKHMGANTKFTATQAGEGLNYMALAGYDAQTSAEMLPKVLDLAAAGAMDLGMASDMVTDAQTALGIKLEDMTEFIDQMAKTASSSNTSVAQLGDAILSIGATGRQVKGGFTELNTILGVLADNGIKASEGGNMLRRILVNLTAPTDNAKEQLEALGVSAFDTQGNMRDLPAVFSDLDKALSSLTDEERTKALSEIFSQYSLAGANALLKTSAERWEELGEKIKDSEGAAKAMAEIQLETLPGQITILQSAISELKTELYEKIAPTTSTFVKKLSEGFSNVVEEVKNGSIASAVSTLGGAIADLIVDGVDVFLENTENIRKFANGILRFTKKVGSALFYAGNVILPTLVKLGADIATNFIKSFSEFLSDTKNITAIEITISGIFTTLQEFLSNNHDNLYNIFSTLFDLGIQFVDDLFMLKRETIYSILGEKILEIVQKLPEKIKEWLSSDGLNDTVTNILTFIGDLAAALIDASAQILPDLLDFVLDIGDKVITGIADYLSNQENVDKIAGTINLLLNKIDYFLNEHEDEFYTIFSTLFDTGIGFVWKIFELRRKTVASTLGKKIKEIFDESWGGIDGIKSHLFSLGTLFIGGIDLGMWHAIEELLDIKKIGQAIVDGFKSFFKIQSPSKLMKDEIGENIAAGLWSGFSEKMEWVKTQISGVLDTVKSIFTGFDYKSISDVGDNIVSGLWNGISNAQDWLIEQIGGFTNGVIDTFKNFFGIASPSKVFRDEIGAYLAQGIGVGFESEMEKVSKDMQSTIPTNFDVNSELITTPKEKSDAYIFEFHIDTINGTTQEDAQAFAKTISSLLYAETYRKKEAFA